jgi:co-chaperonin GroES (HSP10)
MNIQPRNGLVLIRLIKQKEERKTSSGIVIPTHSGTMMDKAEILAVGRGIWDYGKHAQTDDLQPGMLVLIKAGTRGQNVGEQMRSHLGMTVDGEDVSLINQMDVLAIVKEELING